MLNVNNKYEKCHIRHVVALSLIACILYNCIQNVFKMCEYGQNYVSVGLQLKCTVREVII